MTEIDKDFDIAGNDIEDLKNMISEFDDDNCSEFNVEYENSAMSDGFDFEDMIIEKKIGEGVEGIL